MKNKTISMVLIMALITSSIMIPNSFVKARTIGNNDTQEEAGNCADKKEYVVVSEDAKANNNIENIYDAVCCCKSCVRGAIEAGHVEFRDLKYILKDDKNVALVLVNGVKIKNYQMGMDDRTDVYSQRYETATDNAVYELMNRFVNGGEFSIYVLLPQDEKYTLKLNNLKNFILATKTKWDNLSSKTKELVEKLSTSELI